MILMGEAVEIFITREGGEGYIKKKFECHQPLPSNINNEHRTLP
jgi:hypothetical protein